MRNEISRRDLLLGLPIVLAGCASASNHLALPQANLRVASNYGPINDPPYTIPALDLGGIDPGVLRQEVPFSGPYRPGIVVVNIGERRLYHVESGGRAIRYGIGVGREESLDFRGSAVIGRKAAWPSWTPTADMIARIPRYAAYAGGLPGGLANPLGARALYLYRNDQDTHFRLHGTNEPMSIGHAVSSGCIRLFNHDVIDLYNRVAVGTPVIVLQELGPEAYQSRPRAIVLR